jgi:hypothetical protein
MLKHNRRVTGGYDLKNIAECNRKEKGFKIVKSVGAFSGDMESQVYLGIWKGKHVFFINIC